MICSHQAVDAAQRVRACVGDYGGPSRAEVTGLAPAVSCLRFCRIREIGASARFSRKMRRYQRLFSIASGDAWSVTGEIA